MLTSGLLPLGLLDLTLARASGRLKGHVPFSCKKTVVRGIHQATSMLRIESGSSIRQDRGFDPEQNVGVVNQFNPPSTELEQRVRDLQETVVSKEAALNLPPFSEEELVAVYEDLLSIPESESDNISSFGTQLSPKSSIDEELEVFARNGDILKADELLNKSVDGVPTEYQRDLHIAAHIKGTPARMIPTTALSLLHAYEAKGLAAPLSSYTRVIKALFSVRTSISSAQAWDLFSHMRYVAHAQPDAFLYTLMIHACASSPFATGRAEPERALDLWTEMTVDREIAPDAKAYGAIIHACACSGKKEYVNEAFRLAKEMLDSHRDAHGRPAFKPDNMTFRGLLEGAKRVGDLGRARWILAEMVRARNEGDGDSIADGKDRRPNVEVDDEVLVHMFHAYAAYRAPFKRAITLLQDEETATEQSSSDLPAAPDPMVGKEIVPAEDPPSVFSHLPPQSRYEVIAEATALFALVTGTANGTETSSIATETIPNFRNVRPTTRLLNSYLSVYYAHSAVATARQMFNTLFAQLGVAKNALSYVEALEQCGRVKRGRKSERPVALSFARDLWAEWTILEDRWNPMVDNGDELDARLIERAYTAMIRILTNTKNTDQAFGLVKSFFRRYPPGEVRKPSPKPAFRSTRTALVGSRPLVRLSSTVDISDDTVPPLLTFTDVDLLHHRLVAAHKLEDIGFLTYMCKSYENALRVRRDSTMKAEAARPENAVVDLIEVVRPRAREQVLRI